MTGKEKCGENGPYAVRLRDVIDSLRIDAIDAAFARDSELAPYLLKNLGALAGLRLLIASKALDHLLSLSDEERSSLISYALSSFDGKRIAAETVRVSEQIQALLSKEPDIAAKMFAMFDDFLTEADFGKMRVATLAASETLFELGELLIKRTLTDPVIMANLVSAVPDLVNVSIRLLAKALDEIALPAEVLASAVFNTISSLDREEVAKLLNALSKTINNIHAGNVILGGEERELRKVSKDIAVSLAEKVDASALFDAFRALAEDGSDIFMSASEALLSDRDIISKGSALMSELLSIWLRTMSFILSEIAALPEEYFNEFARLLAKGLDPLEAARFVNSLVHIFSSLAQAESLEWKARFEGFLENLDRRAISGLFSSLFWALAGEGVEPGPQREVFSPENIGKILNACIVRYNRSAARGEAAGEFMSGVLSQLEVGELEVAAESLSRGALRVVLDNPDKAAKVISPFVKAAFRVLMVWARSRVRRLLGSSKKSTS